MNNSQFALRIDRPVHRQRQRTFQPLTLQFTGQGVRLSAVTLIYKAVGITAARAVELRPAVTAALLRIQMRLSKIGLYIIIEGSVI